MTNLPMRLTRPGWLQVDRLRPPHGTDPKKSGLCFVNLDVAKLIYFPPRCRASPRSSFSTVGVSPSRKRTTAGSANRHQEGWDRLTRTLIALADGVPPCSVGYRPPGRSDAARIASHRERRWHSVHADCFLRVFFANFTFALVFAITPRAASTFTFREMRPSRERFFNVMRCSVAFLASS
jgi:hypothetical protein